MKHRLPLILSVFGILVFLFSGRLLPPGEDNRVPVKIEDRIVLSAVVQVLIYAGDRFLAADFETARLAATASLENDQDSATYLVRAHSLIAQLNPCHEDNYYLGNALLSWGGAEKEGSELLQRATMCRQWDWVPPFFYAFNQYFFYGNVSEAARSLEIAAQRSPDNYASLKKSAAMMVANEFDDERAALDYLKLQRDQSKDEKLRQMLDKRVGRLHGLSELRRAQKQFESQFSRPLASPDELISSQQLESFPVDPLGLGYEFIDGKFILRSLSIAGTEK